MVGAMSETATVITPEVKNDRGPAAGVTWDLGDLYAGPDDPRLEADLASALDASQRFAARFRTRVAGLDAAELAAAIDELESFEEPAYRAAAFAQLLFAADTSAPRHGALLQRVQERGTEIRNAVVFFELEWVAIDDARAAAQPIELHDHVVELVAAAKARRSRWAAPAAPRGRRARRGQPAGAA